ncbi:MAG: hypothetical protein V4547_17735 [Bacteroidota bacterium]
MEKTDKLNIGSIVERLKAETPPFWKKIRNLGIGIGAAGTALVVAKQQFVMEWLSEPFCEKMIVIGVVCTALSTMTSDKKTDTPA